MCFCASADSVACALLPMEWGRNKGAARRWVSGGINAKAGSSGEVPSSDWDGGMDGGILPAATASRRWDSWRKLRVRFGWLVSSVTMVTLNRQLGAKKGGYFKAASKDGLATQLLSCYLWRAPPTCFLCSLHNSRLHIQIFCTYSRLM